MNPFFAQQQRLHDLIAAHPYFAGLQAEQILTEQIGDLDFIVQNSLLPLGFGVVVMTAEGAPATVGDYGVALSLEKLTLTIIHNPLLDAAHNALDALDAIRAAVIGQSVQAVAPDAAVAWDFFSYAGHMRRHDSLPELHVHELHVTGVLRLQ